MIDPPESAEASSDEIRSRMAYNLNTCTFGQTLARCSTPSTTARKFRPHLGSATGWKLGQSLESWRERMSG